MGKLKVDGTGSGNFTHAFGAVPLRAFRDQSLTRGALGVLGAIAFYDRGGNGCTARNARLAALTGLSGRAVSRHITSLIDAGYVRDVGSTEGLQRSWRRCLVIVRTPNDDAIVYDAGKTDASGPGTEDGHRARRGTPEYEAWLEYYKDKNPERAKLMASRDEWPVPSRMPPAV